jgi:hypothetical protein
VSRAARPPVPADVAAVLAAAGHPEAQDNGMGGVTRIPFV